MPEMKTKLSYSPPPFNLRLISLDDESHSKELASSAEDAKDILSTLGESFNHRETSGAIDDLLDLKPEENGM
ncbi:UNVERIFIED_CONTAM: hypothetical protein K2H54_034473 [Gekko kuhli]